MPLALAVRLSLLVGIGAAALLGACATAPEPTDPTADVAPTPAGDRWLPSAAGVPQRLEALAGLPPYGEDEASKLAAVEARMALARKPNAPGWVVKSLWREDAAGLDMTFAVGLADNIKDPFVRFVTAENRARAEVVRARGQKVTRWLRPNGDLVKVTQVEGGTSARIVDWYADGTRLAVLAVETAPPPLAAETCHTGEREVCKKHGLTFVGVNTTNTRPYKTSAALCAEDNGWACNGVAWEACFGHADCSDAVLATANKAIALLEKEKSDKLPAAIDTLAWVECLRKNDSAATAAWKRACDAGIEASCSLKCAEARKGHTSYAVRCGAGDAGACVSLVGDACAGGSDCSEPVQQAAARALQLQPSPRLIDLNAYVHCRRGELDLANATWQKACAAGSRGSCDMSCRDE